MVSLSLMNHAFELECTPEDETPLEEAAKLLDEKFNEMPASMPNERKAILVALNIAYDYLVLKDESLKNSEHVEEKLNQLLEILQKQDLSELTDNQ